MPSTTRFGNLSPLAPHQLRKCNDSVLGASATLLGSASKSPGDVMSLISPCEIDTCATKHPGISITFNPLNARNPQVHPEGEWSDPPIKAPPKFDPSHLQVFYPKEDMVLFATQRIAATYLASNRGITLGE